jgi:hypothetical protein
MKNQMHPAIVEIDRRAWRQPKIAQPDIQGKIS